MKTAEIKNGVHLDHVRCKDTVVYLQLICKSMVEKIALEITLPLLEHFSLFLRKLVNVTMSFNILYAVIYRDYTFR